MTTDSKPVDAGITRLMEALSRHLGQANGISAELLAAELQVTTRGLRKLVSAARQGEGVAICAHPAHGYYIAVEPAELAATCAFLERRALHSLALLSKMRRVSMPELLGQLKLNQA